MNATGVYVFDSVMKQRLRSFNERSTRVDHIIKDDGCLSLYVADNIHGRGDIGLLPSLVYDGQ